MKVLFATAALCAASALAASEVKSVTLSVEYFPQNGCKTGGVTTKVVRGDRNCVNLDFNAASFEVVGTTKLPNGCTVQGFKGKNCNSFENAYIDGPSFMKCSNNNAGKFGSVRIDCD